MQLNQFSIVSFCPESFNFLINIIKFYLVKSNINLMLKYFFDILKTL